ncbi:AraC family transcriptional regulator [Paenibacillus sp. GYB003]|uniref:AraC family transcriptional regulator n=1 Tax=Paenibacillus sp. GYB003 TaxID=2994392 RepID=UPI002F96258C
MRIPVYRFRMDYLTRYSEFNPLLLFAQKYEFAANESSPLRKCYAHVVVLVESGVGILRLNGNEHPLVPGTLVYIPAGAVHRWESDRQQPMVQRCAYFDWSYVSRPKFRYQRNYFTAVGSFREELASPLPDLRIQEVTRVNNIPLWVSYFNALTPPPELLDDRNPIDILQYNGAFQTFLHHYLSFAAKADLTHDPRIGKILETLERLPPEQTEPALYRLAKELGLGKSRFHDLFKKDTGYTPHEYIRQVQFLRIADDLCLTDLTITEIARKYGYSSIHYFSRSFRSKTGMTPSEYRTKYR